MKYLISVFVLVFMFASPVFAQNKCKCLTTGNTADCDCAKVMKANCPSCAPIMMMAPMRTTITFSQGPVYQSRGLFRGKLFHGGKCGKKGGCG